MTPTEVSLLFIMEKYFCDKYKDNQSRAFNYMYIL